MTYPPNWELVIGLECHVQLKTVSKMFSGAATAYGAEPNTQACALDLALPGTLPTPNRAAVLMAIRFGLAINAPIARSSVFARKNYFYPDLPKGYQLSQYEQPIVGPGILNVTLPDKRLLSVPIERAHLEEDAGKSMHDAFHALTALDFNRAGTPLLEVVSAPAMHSALEAATYMKALHRLVCWIGICDGNLQEGSFRCDANVSVRQKGEQKLGTRTEIKNVNSFRFVEKAIEYEAERQIRELENGGRIVQETRLYDEARHQTRPMRGKESAHDYRYFPDPDLPPLHIPEAWITTEQKNMVELPDRRQQRYVLSLGLSEYDAQLLTVDRATSEYFEDTLLHLSKHSQVQENAKMAANWINGELAAALNANQLKIEQSHLSADALAELLIRILDNTLSNNLAKEVFLAMWQGEGRASDIIQSKGLGQINDTQALLEIINQVVTSNPKQVEQFRAGDEKVFSWLMGQVMRATRGKANPSQLHSLLEQQLRLFS